MSAKKSRKPLLRWGILGAAFLAMWMGWAMSPLGKSAAEIENEVARMRALGAPTTPDELRATTKKPGTNAAPYYIAANNEARKMPAYTKVITLGSSSVWGISLTVAERAELRKSLTELAPVLSKLERGAECERLDFARHYEDGIYMWSRELADMHGLVRVAAADGALSIHEGRVAAGRKRLLTAATMTRHLGGDPSMVSSIVRCALETVVLSATMRALESRPHDPQVRVLARDVLKELGDPVDLHAGTAADFVLMRGTTERMGQRGPEKFFMDMGLKSGDLEPYTIPMLKTRPIRQANEVVMLRYWRVYYENLPKDPEDVDGIRAASESAMRSATSSFWASQMLHRVTTMLSNQAPEAVGRALAARRVVEGALEVLESPSRAQLKRDSFAKGSLKLVRKGSRVWIYSVGQDGKDDGGLVHMTPRSTDSKDLGVVMDLAR